MAEIEEKIVQNEGDVFEEAVQYFGGKLPIPAKAFEALAAEYKSLAFTVSGYTSAEVIKKFYEELLAAVEEGTTLATFRDNMNDFLERQGLEGITPFQADNIFRTNVQTAYQAGNYKQMTEPEVLRLRPYWKYDAVEDTHTRPSHLAMNGKVFPADSPVWDTWYPPNAFRCRCTVRSLSKRQVEDRGLTVETKVPDVVDLGDGRVVHLLPDQRFQSNPAKHPFLPDTDGYPEALKNAYQNFAKTAGTPDNKAKPVNAL